MADVLQHITVHLLLTLCSCFHATFLLIENANNQNPPPFDDLIQINNANNENPLFNDLIQIANNQNPPPLFDDLILIGNANDENQSPTQFNYVDNDNFSSI